MIYDIINSFDEGSEKVSNSILWNSRFENHNRNIYSVLMKLESKKEFFRKQFYDFIFNISKIKVLNVTLEKFLEIENGLSFFWFSNIGQRNIYENRQIIQILKFFALHDLINEKKIKEVNLGLSIERNIQKLFIEFFNDRDIKVNFKNKNILSPKKKGNNFFKINIYAFYFYLIRFSFLKNSKIDSNVTLFDFLIEKNKESNSTYFTSLKHTLSENKLKFGLTHFFYKKNYKNLVQTDLNFFRKIEHIIDREISFKIYIKVLKNLFYLNKKRKKLNELKVSLKTISGKSNFQKIILEDFTDSLLNKDTAKALFYHEIIKKYLLKNKSTKIGIYPLENQPWENILVYNWKKIKNENIYGMIHTTVRFWDLRMFYGNHYNKIKQLLPNNILSNSSFSSENLYRGGYNRSYILEVEGLRYLKSKKLNDLKTRNRILICGDFSTKINLDLLKLNSILLKSFDVDFLPHPTSRKTKFISNKINGKLGKILDNYNLIITSSVSSSSVDAYLRNKIVIQFVQDDSLNFSPLIEFEDVFFFNDINTLVTQLSINKFNKIKRVDKYFFDNPNLIRWKRFLLNI